MNPAGGAKGSVFMTGMNPGGLAGGFCFGGTGLDFLAGMKPGGGVNRFCLGRGMKPAGGAKGSGLGAGMNPAGGVRGLDFGGAEFDVGTDVDVASSVFSAVAFAPSASTSSFSSSCFVSSFMSSLRSWVRVRGRCSLVLLLPIRLVRPIEISSLSCPAALVVLNIESAAEAALAASETADWFCSTVPAGTTRLTTLLTTLTTFLPLKLWSSPGVSGSPMATLVLDSSADDAVDCGPLPVSSLGVASA